MIGNYQAKGRDVVLVHGIHDQRVAARCDRAILAAQMLNRARELNDRQRKYTAAARVIADVERLPGFSWVNEEVTP